MYKYLVDRYIWQGGRKRLAWFGVELAQFSRAEIRIPTNLLLRSTASAHHQHSSLKNTLNIEQYDCVQKDSQPITYHGSGVTKRERTSERCKFSENILGFIWALKKKKKSSSKGLIFSCMVKLTRVIWKYHGTMYKITISRGVEVHRSLSKCGKMKVFIFLIQFPYL